MEEKTMELDDEKVIRVKKKADGDTEIIDPEFAVDMEEEQEDEEVVFEMPEEEDNEELASMSKEEAKAYYLEQLRKEKEREEKGKAFLLDAQTCEGAGDLKGAYLSYLDARDYLGVEPEIVVGALKCGTNEFTSVENLKELTPIAKELRDLDDETKSSFSVTFGEAISATFAKINEERDPLKEKVETKRAERAIEFGGKLKKASRNLIISGSISLVCAILTVVFFNLIFSRSDLLFLILGIASAGVFLVSLIISLVLVKMFVNARNRVVMNGDNKYSNDGRRLNVLNEQYEFYRLLSEIK